MCIQPCVCISQKNDKNNNWKKWQHPSALETASPRTYPSSESCSSLPVAWPSWKGKTVIWLKERLSWRKDGLHTVGSSSRSGPMQLCDTLSALRAGKRRTSPGSDCNWFPWRSRRVRLLKLWGKENNYFIYAIYKIIILQLGHCCASRKCNY